MPNYSITKTPVKIQFSSPIETSNTISNAFEEYKLAISVDASNLYATEQFLPQQYIIEVPTNGVVELRLIPSTSAHPNFRYRVKYYGDNRLLDEQYWVIPPAPEKRTQSIDVFNGTYTLPIYIYEVLELRPQVEYTVTNGVLYISTDGVYTVDYVPAVTLNEIVVPNE